MAAGTPHQYIDRATGSVRTERLYRDALVNFLYAHTRENAPQLFNLLVSPHMSRLLAYFVYDGWWNRPWTGPPPSLQNWQSTPPSAWTPGKPEYTAQDF